MTSLPKERLSPMRFNEGFAALWRLASKVDGHVDGLSFDFAN